MLFVQKQSNKDYIWLEAPPWLIYCFYSCVLTKIICSDLFQLNATLKKFNAYYKYCNTAFKCNPNTTTLHHLKPSDCCGEDKGSLPANAWLYSTTDSDTNSRCSVLHILHLGSAYRKHSAQELYRIVQCLMKPESLQSIETIRGTHACSRVTVIWILYIYIHTKLLFVWTAIKSIMMKEEDKDIIKYTWSVA